MSYSDDEFKIQMVEGQKTILQQMGNMSGEISVLKNNAAKFESEMRSHLESNDRTKQKGAIEIINDNKEEIKVIKNDMDKIKKRIDVLSNKIKDIIYEIKIIVSDVLKLKTDWKVMVGKTGVGLAIFSAIGALLWKLVGVFT